MTMQKNTNVSPYFNDFDEFKNFHQILFRPGYSVQARELTQMQSILRNQIEKFGNHIFKQGSIVIPGNSRAELSVPYVKLETVYGNVPIIPDDWVGKVVVGATSGVTAIVKHAEAATDTDPLTFYLGYTSGGVVDSVPNGKVLFDNGEDIYLLENSSVLATVQATAATGLGSIAYINQGVYYVNGTFVTVESQSTVISKYSTTPSCSVLLQIKEEFVTFEDDTSLLDPAQGSYNFAAPGADRLKLSLALTSLPLETAITNDYVEIMRYSNGILLEHARTPKYNELEKSLARRTYDESGDYIVSGYNTTVREHLKKSSNGGLDEAGSRSNYVVSVTAGKAYISGFEVENIAGVDLVVPKARTADHVKLNTVNLRPRFGRYIYVSNIIGGPSIATRQVVTLYNDNDPANGSASALGTARVLSIDYHLGDPTSNDAIYKLWLTDVTFSSVLYTMDDVGGIRFSGGSAGVAQVLTSPLSLGTHNVGNIITYNTNARLATVKYWDATKSELYVTRHDHTKLTPKVGDQITNATTGATSVVQSKQSLFGSDSNSALFVLPPEYVKSLRNGSNVYNLQYSVQKELTITTDVSGNGFVSIASGVMRTPDAGTFAAFYDGGVVETALFNLNIAGNELTLTGGPVSKTVKIFIVVDKNGVTPKTKTLTTSSVVVSSTANQTVVTLDKPDVYRIRSILLGSTDVTDRYYLDNGQTDYAYYKSSIVLRPGKTAPVGTLTVEYDYFQHSAGDFFVYDSYSLNPDYESFVLQYMSQSTGIEYNLANCIDCRPSVNSSNTFTTGAVVGDMLVNNERFFSSIQYYVPRIDVLALYKTGELKIVQGTPDEEPTVPSSGFEAIAIESYFVPAYTDNILDIKKTRLGIERYTMQDISALSDRIGRLEEFSTLSASENSLVNFDVVDAETGLSRFKTGYLVETFNTPLVIGDVYNDSFCAAFDANRLISAVEDMDCPVSLLPDVSSEYQITNGFISLPYTEVTLASQPLSSRVTNLNPFLVISWNGILSCTPNKDSWIEVTERPTIFINRQESVTTTRVITAPAPTVSVGFGRSIAARQIIMPQVTPPFVRTTPVATTTSIIRSSTFSGGTITTPATPAAATPAVTNVAPARSGVATRRKIICSKLYDLGLMDYKTFEIDQKFGEILANADPLIMEGYQTWAQIVVDWMSGEGINMGIPKEVMRKWATKWAHDIATPWSKEMSLLMGSTSEVDKAGQRIMKIGKKLSKFVATRGLMKKPNWFTGAGLISVFAFLKLIILISR